MSSESINDNSDVDEPGLNKLNDCKIVDLEHFSEIPDFSDSLSVLNVNLRGINNNFVSLKTFLAGLKATIKVIVIIEAHTEDNTVGMYNLNGYRKAFVNRSKFGGGIIAFVHSSLEVNIDMKYTGITEYYETLFSLYIVQDRARSKFNFCVVTYHIGTLWKSL